MYPFPAYASRSINMSPGYKHVAPLGLNTGVPFLLFLCSAFLAALRRCVKFPLRFTLSHAAPLGLKAESNSPVTDALPIVGARLPCPMGWGTQPLRLLAPPLPPSSLPRSLSCQSFKVGVIGNVLKILIQTTKKT